MFQTKFIKLQIFDLFVIRCALGLNRRNVLIQLLHLGLDPSKARLGLEFEGFQIFRERLRNNRDRFVDRFAGHHYGIF